MFLQACVCPQGGGVSTSVHAPPDQTHTPPTDQADPLDKADPPDQADTPQTRQTPPRTRQTPPDQADPPGPDTPPQDQADTPWTRQNPPGPGRPPQTRQTPPEEDCSIRSMSGRHASYWNAFLLQ